MDDQRDGNYLWEKIGHSQEIVIKYKKGEKYAYNIKLRKLMDWNRHDTI